MSGLNPIQNFTSRLWHPNCNHQKCQANPGGVPAGIPEGKFTIFKRVLVRPRNFPLRKPTQGVIFRSNKTVVRIGSSISLPSFLPHSILLHSKYLHSLLTLGFPCHSGSCCMYRGAALAWKACDVWGWVKGKWTLLHNILSVLGAPFALVSYDFKTLQLEYSLAY